jgi:hypothetical protein
LVCPRRLSLAFDRDCNFFAGSIVTLDMLWSPEQEYSTVPWELRSHKLATFGSTPDTWHNFMKFHRPHNLSVRRVLGDVLGVRRP